MSCGRFVCGMRKFDQHKQFEADRPSNPALFQENQKSLQELIRLREQQDAGQFAPIPNQVTVQNTMTSTSHSEPTPYTPWKTPPTN